MRENVYDRVSTRPVEQVEATTRTAQLTPKQAKWVGVAFEETVKGQFDGLGLERDGHEIIFPGLEVARQGGIAQIKFPFENSRNRVKQVPVHEVRDIDGANLPVWCSKKGTRNEASYTKFLSPHEEIIVESPHEEIIVDEIVEVVAKKRYPEIECECGRSISSWPPAQRRHEKACAAAKVAEKAVVTEEVVAELGEAAPRHKKARGKRSCWGEAVDRRYDCGLGSECQVKVELDDHGYPRPHWHCESFLGKNDDGVPYCIKQREHRGACEPSCEYLRSTSMKRSVTRSVDRETTAQLMAMGFEESDVTQALGTTGGKFDKALNMLLGF